VAGEVLPITITSANYQFTRVETQAPIPLERNAGHNGNTRILFVNLNDSKVTAELSKLFEANEAGG
jgi:hypothetical protein